MTLSLVDKHDTGTRLICIVTFNLLTLTYRQIFLKQGHLNLVTQL